MFIKGKKSPRLDVHHGKDSARVSGVILPSGHLGFFFPEMVWFLHEEGKSYIHTFSCIIFLAQRYIVVVI